MSDWKMRREEVEQLIAAYKKHKCLWDYRTNEYKLHDLKKQSWQKLGKMFGKDANDVKRKIKCLRSAYGSEKRKVDDSYRARQIYKSNLFYFKQLSFLDAVIVCRQGPKLKKFEHDSDPIAACDEEPTESTYIERYATEEVSQPSSPNEHQIASDSHLKLRKQQHRLSPYYSKLDVAVNTLAEVTKTSSEESVYTAFGKTIALQLSELPTLDAATTMSEIHQILSKNTINSLLSKKRSSYRAHRETDVEAVNGELSESSLDESNLEPSEFEEVPV